MENEQVIRDSDEFVPGRSRAEAAPPVYDTFEEFEQGETFDRDEFVDQTDIVEWKPVEAPREAAPLKVRIRTNALSGNAMREFRRAVDQVRFNANRMTFLSAKIAKMGPMPEDNVPLAEIVEKYLPENVTADEADEYVDCVEEYRRLKSDPDETEINIRHICRPNTIALTWNMTVSARNADGSIIPNTKKPVALNEENLRNEGVALVGGLTTAIIRRVYGERDPKRSHGRTKKHTSRGSRATRR